MKNPTADVECSQVIRQSATAVSEYALSNAFFGMGA